jgi:hypothetical protein
MSETRKPTSLGAIQVKNRQMTIVNGEKLDITSDLNKYEMLTYTVMLYLLILAYVQFLIMLTELQKVLSQELKCLCS